MRCLLDTNVVSEATRPQPDPKVLAWLSNQDLAETYLSVVTIGEIEQGISRLGRTRRADSYRTWLEEELRNTYAGRILSLDEAILRTWGRVTGEAIKQGRPPALLDSFLASTAITHDLVLVTRNTQDVTMLSVEPFDPWQASTV